MPYYSEFYTVLFWFVIELLQFVITLIISGIPLVYLGSIFFYSYFDML